MGMVGYMISEEKKFDMWSTTRRLLKTLIRLGVNASHLYMYSYVERVIKNSDSID